MAYELTWLAEKRVIDLRMWGTPTLEEVQTINAQMLEMMNQGTPPVHTLTDETEVSPRALPPDLKLIVNTLTIFQHPSLGWALAYSPHIGGFARMLTGLVTQFNHVNYRRFDSREAALAFLRELEPNLNL